MGGKEYEGASLVHEDVFPDTGEEKFVNLELWGGLEEVDLGLSTVVKGGGEADGFYQTGEVSRGQPDAFPEVGEFSVDGEGGRETEGEVFAEEDSPREKLSYLQRAMREGDIGIALTGGDLDPSNLGGFTFLIKDDFVHGRYIGEAFDAFFDRGEERGECGVC